MSRTTRPLAGKRVALVVAHRGFREEELERPRAALLAAGAEVEVASSSLAPAHGMHGGECYPDRLYSALSVEDLDAVVFVGGEGSAEFFPDLTAHRLCRDAVAQDKLLGSICFAGSILANAGVLEGKPATAFPSREAHLRARGAAWTGDPVTHCGRIVTARGPEDADAFAQALVHALS